LRILVIQLRAIGDVICTIPVLDYLKRALPRSGIDFLVEPVAAPVLQRNPNLSEILIYNPRESIGEIRRIRARSYDAVLDFFYNPRTAYLSFLSGARWRVAFKRRYRSLFYNLSVPVPLEPEYAPLRKIRLARAWLDKIGAEEPAPVSSRPRIFLSAEDEAFADGWIREKGIGNNPFVVVFPIHKRPLRQWRSEGFRSVGLSLARKGLRVFLACAPGDEPAVAGLRRGVENELELAPATTLPRMGALIKKSRLVICNDSGALHLAAAVGTPTVGIYGPASPKNWNPSYAGGTGPVQDIPLTAQGVPCLGCELDRCPVGHICMTRLSEQEVLSACERMLGI
jgi:heptosyltransferase-3